MARSKKDLEGWQLVFAEEKTGVDSPVRRSRRSAPAVANEGAISVRRDDDQLVLKQGDIIQFEDEGGVPTLGLIRDIRLDTDKFLSMPVFLFIRLLDIDESKLPADYTKDAATSANEVFVTVYQESVRLASVLDKVKVVSMAEFNDVVVDISTANAIFVCRRASDIEGSMLSPEFDFKEVMQMFRNNQQEFMEYLKSETVTAARKTPAPSPRKKRPLPTKEKEESSTPRKKLAVEGNAEEISEDDNNDSSSSAVIESEDEDESELLESEDEKPKRKRAPKAPVKRQPKSPAKSVVKSPAKSSPRKPRKSALTSPEKVEFTGFKVKVKVSPLKSAFVSSRKTTQLRKEKPESAEFRQIREKLSAGSERLRNLPARELEYMHILEWLVSSVMEEQGECFYISGTPGVGKTATVRAVIEDMLDMVSKNELTEFDYLEINGLKLISPNNAYESLWKKISGRRATPNAALLALEKHFKDKEAEAFKNNANGRDVEGKPLIVLIDELDQIVTKKQNILYNFFNWPTYRSSKLIVIAIGNTMDLPERVLSNKISSRLGEKRYQFVGYTYDQLVNIVQNRLSEIKRNDNKIQINDTAIVLAARKVASVSGDARRALNICRRAVEIAEKEYTESNSATTESKYEVSFKHITKAVLETVNSPTAQFLRTLSFASKLALVAMLNQIHRKLKAENSLGEIIDEMKNAILRLISPQEKPKPNNNNNNNNNNTSTSIYDLLYCSGLIDGAHRTKNIRIKSFNYIITELKENGIINEQPILSERYRTVNLNVSHEEVLSVLKEDALIYSLVHETR